MLASLQARSGTWLLGRLLLGPFVLALWAALLVATGVFARAFDLLPPDAGPGRRGLRATGVSALIVGFIFAIGTATGSDDPRRPLARLASCAETPSETQLALGAASLGHYQRTNTALMATEGRLENDIVEGALRDAGFDIADLDAAYREDRTRWDALLSRISQQATLLGLRGTPAFIIGTTVYSGSMGQADLRDAIKAARN